jgi:hypothetical protein
MSRPPGAVALLVLALAAAACGAPTPAAPRGTPPPSPRASASPSLPPVSADHVLASLGAGPVYAVGDGWLYADVEVHGEGVGGTPQLVRYDLATLHRDTTVLDLTENPMGIALAGGVVHLLLPDQLLLVDAATLRITARIHLPGAAARLSVGGGSDWVADSSEGKVLRVDTRRSAVVASITVSTPEAAAQLDGGDPSIVAWSNGSVWTNLGAVQKVARIDPATNTVAAAYATPFGGIDTMQPTADGGVWMDFFDDGRFVHVDPAGHMETLPYVFPQPTGFVVRGNDIWFASHRIGELRRVDITSGQVSERILVEAPAGQVLDDGTSIWAWGNGHITRVDPR